MNPQLAINLISKYRYIFIIAVLVLIVTIYLLVRRKKTDSERIIDAITIDKKNTSITDNQATIIVENLLSAMDQYGTDEQSIIDNLNGLNKDDLLLVIRKFGIKPYNGASLATNWIDRTLFSPEKNLIAWLKSELSGSALETVKQIFESNEIPF